jgi:LmbE family N-acetylglucosaminyl deacetylase
MGTRLLCIAAHPDAETLGAGAWLMGVRDVYVVHVTDGAPRDPRRRTHPELSRSAYARLRRDEVRRALAVARMAPWRAWSLGAVGLEAVDSVTRLAPELARVIREVRPTAIVTHPYEGGHPDYDATALLVYAACELLRRRRAHAPDVFEMTSYYPRNGRVAAHSFLAPNLAAHWAEPVHSRRLSCEERAAKRAMLDCFASQRAVLDEVGTCVERVRVAPLYQFDCAPQLGPLLYELQGMGSGRAWRARAMRALAELDLAPLAGTAAE